MREAQTLYPNAKFSYLAHSFGTYVVAKMLIDDPNFIANRIVFCGSVLKSDFPFSKLRGFSAPLLNEVGTRDIWPFLAASLTWGYGSAGSVGFGQPYVKDRFHHHGHSQFLSAKFAQDYWVPFLQNGQLIEGVVPPPPNFTRRLLSTFSIKYFLVALLSFVAVWWKIYRPDLNCTERWLNQKEYNSCFQESKDESVPIIVEGRRSWFGYGNDEFNAKWVFRSTNICYDSRSLLDRDNFAELNARLTNLGYIPISVKSFLSSDNTERFQSTWLYEKESAANCPQY